MVLGAQLAAEAVRTGRVAPAMRGAAIVLRQYWSQLVGRTASLRSWGGGSSKDQSMQAGAMPLGQPLDWADHTFNAVRCLR